MGIRAWPLLAATALLQGCFFLGGDDEDPLAKCRGTEEYQQAGSIPELQVPEGLAEPTATSVFEIPGGPQGDGQDPEAGCLARPPLFFDRPVGGSPEAAARPGPDSTPPPPTGSGSDAGD